MYARDVEKISRHALATPEGLFDVVEFVLLTIRQPLQQVISQRVDISKNGGGSRFLFSSKRAGWNYASENKGYLHRVALDILRRPDSADRKADLIQHFMQVPGLGMVKAAFVVQCIGGGTACIDSHNLARLGLPIKAVKIGPNLKPETVRKKVLAYVSMCDETGGSEHWWDTWCSYVAGRRGSPLKTADQVSAYHTDAVVFAA